MVAINFGDTSLPFCFSFRRSSSRLEILFLSSGTSFSRAFSVAALSVAIPLFFSRNFESVETLRWSSSFFLKSVVSTGLTGHRQQER